MITPQYELIKEEADNLKKFATKDELNKLNFYHLYPKSGSFCIYGQMTGSCNSPRAIQLLNLSTKPFTGRISKYIPVNDESFNFDHFRYMFSPIEYFIAQDYQYQNHNNEILINYLKGISNTLEFKFHA